MSARNTQPFLISYHKQGSFLQYFYMCIWGICVIFESLAPLGKTPVHCTRAREPFPRFEYDTFLSDTWNEYQRDKYTSEYLINAAYWCIWRRIREPNSWYALIHNADIGMWQIPIWREYRLGHTEFSMWYFNAGMKIVIPYARNDFRCEFHPYP